MKVQPSYCTWQRNSFLTGVALVFVLPSLANEQPLFSFLLPYISLLLEILLAIQAPAFQVSIMQIHFSL